MMRLILSIVSMVLLANAIESCSRSGGSYQDDGGGGGPHVFVPTDTVAPQLAINTPTVGQAFTSGSTVNITGRLTDDYGLYRGTIRMTNDANGLSLLNQPYEIHGFLSYDFNLNQVVNVTTATDFTVTVSFEDHGYNSVTKSVKIRVNP